MARRDGAIWPMTSMAARGTLPPLEVSIVNLLVAGFLTAHGLVHALYLTPAPQRTAGSPEWPFDMSRSWLVTRAGQETKVVSAIGVGLVALTIIGFALSALGAAGWIVPAALWPLVVTGSVAASVLLLAFFFHPWLGLGLLIDAAILVAVVVVGWNPALDFS